MWHIHPYYITMIMVGLNLHNVICGSFTSEEGPFELVVHNTSKCVQEQSWFRTNITAFGRNSIRGTFISERELKNVKFRVQAFYLENDNVMKVFEIKNQNCHNMVVRLILTAIRVPYDHQKCTMKPVSREFTNLDVNYIVQAIVQSAWYGSVQIRWEIDMPETRLMCLNINFQSIKPNNVKTKQ